MNQQCKVCGEPAAGFHFGAFTCEGCKSFFGRTYNNLSSISECKNNGECIINKKNRTACKACRLRKCLVVGMSKSGSRYGRRSNWFKIHCLLQEQQQAAVQASQTSGHSGLELQKSLPTHSDLAGFYAQAFASSLSGSTFMNPLCSLPRSFTLQQLPTEATSDSGTSSAEEDTSDNRASPAKLKINNNHFLANHRFHPFLENNKKISHTIAQPSSPSSDPGCFFSDKKNIEKQFSPPPSRVSISSLSWPNTTLICQNGAGSIDPNAWKDLWLRPLNVTHSNNNVDPDQDQPIDLSTKKNSTICSVDVVEVKDVQPDKIIEESVKPTPLDLTKRNEILGT